MAVTKVIRLERSDIFVNVPAGDFLLFRMAVQGSNPVFELTDTGAVRSLLSQQDQEVSPSVWERRWPRSEDPVANHTNCVVTLIFPNAITYTYQVEHSTRGLLIDIDFQASGHEPAIFRALGVDTP